MNNRQPNSIEPKSSRRSPWLLASLALHAVVLLFLFQQPQAEDATLTKRPPVTSAKRIEELSENVREIQTKKLQEKVHSLEKVLQQMETIERAKSQQLRDLNPDNVESSHEQAETERARALTAQQQALELIDQAIEADEKGDMDLLNKHRQQAIEKQFEAEAALNRVASAHQLSDQSTDSAEDLIRKQVDASQKLAVSQFKDAQETKLRDQNRQHAAQFAQQQQQLDAHLAELEMARQKFKQAEADKARAQQEVLESEKNFQELNQRVEEARGRVTEREADFRKAQDTRDQKKIQKAENELNMARDEVNRKLGDRNQGAHMINVTKHKVSVAEHQMKHQTSRIEFATERAQRIKDQMESSKPTIASSQPAAGGDQKQPPAPSQTKNSSASETTNRLKDARKSQQAAIAGISEPLQASNKQSQSFSTAPSQTAEDNLAQAQMLERQIARRFKDFRAAEMSLVHQMSPEKARQLIDVAVPERDSIDPGSLDRTVSTHSAMKQNLADLEAAVRQAEAMDNFASSLLAQAMNSERAGLKINLTTQQSEAAAETRQSAQDQSGAVSDMTQLMARRSRQKNGQHATEGSDKLSETSHTIVDQQAIASSPIPPDMKVAAGSRRFGSNNGSANAESGWTFVDSWYILGPFDNPNRANIHKKFPPENLLDLDAKFRTKASPTPISWEFFQSAEPKVEPLRYQGEYVIYYAWTQLNFEVATDVWIAVGSDDRSDLWINDIRVWSSSDQLKAWRINEGKRRVRFRAGLNDVLYRIENGNGPWAFSMCLNVGTAVPVQE